jgi:hypothetical protein
MNTLFYMVYFKSTKPIMELNDFIFDASCSVVVSKPYIKKEMVVAKVLKYSQVCIVYNALTQTYSNDPRHKNFDFNVIRILMLWAKNNIPRPIQTVFGLDPIKEETPEELHVFNIR